MENMPFVMWMVGYPLANYLGQYVSVLRGEVYGDDVKGITAILTFLIWAFVGWKLYK